MNKAIITLVLLALAAPNAVLAMNTGAADVEQIPSPEYIEFYQVLEQRGNSLWGHRLISKEEMKARVLARQQQKKAEQQDKKEAKDELKADQKEAKAAAKEAKKLEKIPSPPFIKFFEGVQKVGTSLWGFVKKSWAYGLGRITAENAPCVATALGNRDAAIRTAIAANNTAMLAAYDARSTCQQTALTKDTPNEMVTALLQCGSAYQAARKEAGKLLLTSRQTAWELFRGDLKECGQAVNPDLEDADETTQDIVDAIDDEDTTDVADDSDEDEDADDDDQDED
jgi:hypothetical protein